MAQFCNPEKEGRSQEVERVPAGFGAPRRTSVASHGVLYSGWQPNPERSLTSAPWFRVECCTRWPAHNESYINGLCGHRIHEGCLLTLVQPYHMEACPVCCAHTTHHDREGWFRRNMFASFGCFCLVLNFLYIKKSSVRFLCLHFVTTFMSVPSFFYRMSNHHRHGYASP